jgi:HEAT repeat protein
MTRLCLILAALLAGAGGARAQDVDALQLKKEVRNPDDNKAADAAAKLGEDASPKALDAILDELSVGAPPKVQAALLAGLAGRKDARAVEVLSLYTHNRNPELRKKAVVAIAELSDKRAVPVLVGALSDSVEEVRAAAAGALGKRKEASAEGPLIQLLAHKDPAAVGALGQIGGAQTARKLGELIGTIPDGLLASTMGELLKRPDFGPDPLRVEVVKMLAKVPGADSTAALVEYVAATEKDKARPSRAAAKKAIEEKQGGSN